MKEYRYSIAWYDRKMGTVSTYVEMPMEGVPDANSFPEFLQNAGKQGWLLCGAVDGYYSAGMSAAQPNPEAYAKATGQTSRKVTDPKEVIELIFAKEI